MLCLSRTHRYWDKAVKKRILHISPCLAEFPKPTFHAIYTKSLRAKFRYMFPYFAHLSTSRFFFLRVPKAAKIAYCLRHFRPSVRKYHLGFQYRDFREIGYWGGGTFIKICQENSNFGKIEQKCREFSDLKHALCLPVTIIATKATSSSEMVSGP